MTEETLRQQLLTQGLTEAQADIAVKAIKAAKANNWTQPIKVSPFSWFTPSEVIAVLALQKYVEE